MRKLLFLVNFMLRSYYSAFTHSQNSPVEFVTKRISKKFHQGALSLINFGDVLAQFCQASIHVYPRYISLPILDIKFSVQLLYKPINSKTNPERLNELISL